MSARVRFDLAKMTPEAQEVWMGVYGLGYQHGLEAGYQRCLDDDADRWAEMRRSIRATANSPDYATLCRRRGHHARAEATEALWAERGLAS